MKRIILFAIMIAFATSSFGQKIKVADGKYKALKGVKKINVEFVYDEDLKVGKVSEDEYIAKKRAKKEEKKAGDGDKWEAGWKNARPDRYEVKFMELFKKVIGKKGFKASTEMENADVTMVVHTYFIEPGFNIGIMRKPASVSWYVIFLDENGKEILRLDSIKAPGADAIGADFDATYRIAEGYAKGGKKLAKTLLKKALK